MVLCFGQVLVRLKKVQVFKKKKTNIINERESPEEMNDTQMNREIGLMIGPRVIRSHSKFVQWRGILDTVQRSDKLLKSFSTQKRKYYQFSI